jgi:DNA-binding PadR family transcriptional regulator
LSSELTTFSYVVLALVGRGGAGPHDLVRMMRADPLYWAGSESQTYAEPKRLEKLGYLDSTKQPGVTRERTNYQLTLNGLEALRAWLAEPATFPRIYHEAVVKVMAGDLVDPAVTVASVQHLKAELAKIRSRIDAGAARAASITGRTRYLDLNARLARRLVDAHEQWIAEIEAELGSDDSQGDR